VSDGRMRGVGRGTEGRRRGDRGGGEKGRKVEKDIVQRGMV